jgi:hypothetical protein
LTCRAVERLTDHVSTGFAGMEGGLTVAEG